jgi:Collagen triple helix repeat (20 copies)
MNEEVKDYEDDYEDTEEVVLTRWGKIKQWIEIIVATKKVAMVVWSLVFATGSAVVVGQVTDTQPIRDAAVAMGILDERRPINPTEEALLDEVLNLQQEVLELIELRKADLEYLASHEHGFKVVNGKDGKDGERGERGPEGPQGIQGDKGRPGQDGNMIVDYQIDQLFSDHVDVLH